MKPLVSILIPAFNAEPWIENTLRSALRQTWDAKEIIVIDDGSTDNTVEIATRIPGVRVEKQQNQGAAAARNAALRLSQGDYIQWLDADDLLAPDKVERQMAVALQRQTKKTLLSGSWGAFMYRDSHARFIPTALWCDQVPLEWLLSKMGQNLYMQTATWLTSRELVEAAGPWDTRLSVDDDGEYFCRVLLASDGVCFVPQSKVYYRTFGYDSLSYIGLSKPKCEAHWLSMQLHIKYLRSLEDSPRVRQACVQYLRNSLLHFYPEHPRIVQEAETIATELGIPLGPPSLSWKYSWVKSLFGWYLAKHVQVNMRKTRWRAERLFDNVLYRLQSGMGNHQHATLDEGLPPMPLVQTPAQVSGTLAPAKEDCNVRSRS